MEVVAFILLAFFIAIIILVNALYRSAKKPRPRQVYTLPDLGMQEHNEEFGQELKAFIEHLDKSLDETYVERVKERVIREHKISLTEWDNRWFEWKRYLVITALMKNVPMYSREVDEVWHEMLMFTREYDDFSRRFLKTTLHHAPNDGDQPFNPHERAWFDTIYVCLFKPTKFSVQTWGAFLRHPLHRDVIQELKEESVTEIANRYFNAHTQENVPHVGKLVSFLIHYLKEKLAKIDEAVAKEGPSVSRFKRYRHSLVPHPDEALIMLTGVLFLSTYHEDEFAAQYQRLQLRSSTDGGSHTYSGCSYVSGCSSGNDGGSGGDHGGSSCSSSSCSSSSCGGGGCGGSS
ncbi:hypothetical protein [Laceyella putida]|uniref:Uncharacterized protein n=1 Tax=Laceyella putida TaxID=110101 RepID=A0ABW2RLV9_9BACL